MNERPPRGEFALLLCTLLAVAVCAYTPVWDPDTFWHLAVGKEIVRSGHLMRVETFSFAVPGVPWEDTEWLFHLAAYPLWRVGGFALLQVVTAGAAFLAVFIAYTTTRALGASTLAFCFLVSLFMGPLLGRMRFRPDLASALLFALLAGVLLSDAAVAPTLRTRGVWIVLIFFAWIQLHGGWAYGGFLLGCYVAGGFLDSAARRDFFAHRGPLLLTLSLAAAVLFLNPYGATNVVFPFKTLTSFFDPQYISIAEWARTPISLETFPFLAGCLGLLVASLYLAGIRRGRWGEVVLIAGQVALALLWIRYCTYAVLILLPFGATYLTTLLKVRKWRALAAIAVLALLATHVFSRLWPPQNEETLSINYPVEEVAFLKASGVGGATFHTFVSGGYLDLEYYPLGRILFDGRYFPFKNLLGEYFRSKETVNGLRAFLNNYPFQIALYPYTNATIAAHEPGAPPRGVCTALFMSDRWTLVYMGAYGAVYVRNGQAPEKWLEKHSYLYLVPGDEAYLAWEIRGGLVPRDRTLSEVDRALREGSAIKGRPQLESLRLGLLQIGER